jgi:isopentenyl diphosphate isomerase/L-lactate dehydrogenase-like FMN-dependent dehydrogenase
MHGLAYPHGDDNSGAERATARAAAKHNTLMIVSTYATTHMEEIIQPVQKYSKSPFWYQLYVLKDRKITEFMVTNAEKLGYSAIVVTVDAPSIGNRELDARNSFGLPPGLTYPNVMMAKKEGITHKDFAQDAIDPSLSWKDIQWLKSITRLPIIIKGIMTKEDAILAVHHGASAIIVSNHGARQLDTVMATIDALPSITRAVKEYGIDVYVDGGIRRGTDVLKCLCLGAKAVLVARPILWGLAVDGEKGVFDVIQILRKELETAMVLAGIPDVKNCTSAQVYRERRAKL